VVLPPVTEVTTAVPLPAAGGGRAIVSDFPVVGAVSVRFWALSAAAPSLYNARVLAPSFGALMAPTMPFWQCLPVVCEQ
jgi:hypothetical protein